MSRTIMNLEESRELEARCAVRMGLDTLMRRAGTFAAKWLDERLPCPHVTVLAGPGNNGGDAIVCVFVSFYENVYVFASNSFFLPPKITTKGRPFYLCTLHSVREIE